MYAEIVPGPTVLPPRSCPIRPASYTRQAVLRGRPPYPIGSAPENRAFTRLTTGARCDPHVIFKDVRDGRPYPDHQFSSRDWARIPPRQVRLDELVATKRQLALDRLLADDSTFYGDLFPHAVQWKGDLYLEDGLHRALRTALQQRTSLHVRVLNLDELNA